MWVTLKIGGLSVGIDPVCKDWASGTGGLVYRVVSCPALYNLMCQAPLSMEFSRQEHWSKLPFPIPGDLPDPGIKPMSLVSPVLAGTFFTIVPPKKSTEYHF